jgi:hypothetical protein
MGDELIETGREIQEQWPQWWAGEGSDGDA